MEQSETSTESVSSPNVADSFRPKPPPPNLARFGLALVFVAAGASGFAILFRSAVNVIFTRLYRASDVLDTCLATMRSCCRSWPPLERQRSCPCTSVATPSICRRCVVAEKRGRSRSRVDACVGRADAHREVCPPHSRLGHRPCTRSKSDPGQAIARNGRDRPRIANSSGAPAGACHGPAQPRSTG